MALIDVGADLWLGEYESCDRLSDDIAKQLSDRNEQLLGSGKFNAISASARIHLSQFKIELDQLTDRLKLASTVTHEERERRLRLVEGLESKYVHLCKLYRTNSSKTERRQLFGDSSWADGEDGEEEADSPLLGATASVHELKADQKRALEEQDRGLSKLSTIIGRQKNIAITISEEVNTQNDIIDDLSGQMEATTSGIRATTSGIVTVSSSDSTWFYWMVILILFACIIGLVI